MATPNDPNGPAGFGQGNVFVPTSPPPVDPPKQEETPQQKSARLAAELAAVQAEIAAAPPVVVPHVISGIKDGCEKCFTQLGDFLDAVGRHLGIPVPQHTDDHNE